MKRMGWGWMMAMMIVAMCAVGAAPSHGRAADKVEDSSAKAKARKDKKLELSGVVLRVNHRVFANFAQLDTVLLDQEFPVGDSDLSARIIRFVPDFTIDRDRAIVSRSNEPKNPAVQIVVMEAGAAHDTSWAFLNFPPHFSAKSVLAFQIVRLDFKNHEPLINKALMDRKAAEGDEP